MTDRWTGLQAFLDILGLDEEPMGVFYTNQAPTGLTPRPMAALSREKEDRGEIDWGPVFGNFSCSIGHIWRARRKKTAAWFDAEHYGCVGAAFYMGFMKPQLEMIVHYVSTGIPGHLEGEYYLDSPQSCRAFFEQVDPRPAPGRYVVFKPLSQLAPNEEPELVTFFTRPEALSGLHQLVTFVTGDFDVVRSPFGAGCTNLVTWPLFYLARGLDVAVLGGWDPSARPFFKNDELSFTVSCSMFSRMLAAWPESFLTRNTWKSVQKKIARGKRAWGETPTALQDVPDDQYPV